MNIQILAEYFKFPQRSSIYYKKNKTAQREVREYRNNENQEKIQEKKVMNTTQKRSNKKALSTVRKARVVVIVLLIIVACAIVSLDKPDSKQNVIASSARVETKEGNSTVEASKDDYYTSAHALIAELDHSEFSAEANHFFKTFGQIRKYNELSSADQFSCQKRVRQLAEFLQKQAIAGNEEAKGLYKNVWNLHSSLLEAAK